MKMTKVNWAAIAILKRERDELSEVVKRLEDMSVLYSDKQVHDLAEKVAAHRDAVQAGLNELRNQVTGRANA